MGRIITAPGVLTNVQGQIDHALDLYQDIKDNNMKPLTVTLDPVTNANGSYTHITEDSRITEEMKAIAFEAGTPEVFLSPVSITTADGSATLTCSNAVGTSTVTVTFVHTWPVDGGEDVPERVTSTEFDILADRIGSLSTLETTDKTSIVNAVNSLKDETDTHLTEVQDGLAIISNGDTHVAIPANQYVFVKNHNSLTNGLYKAKSAIGANAALSTSNLTADPAGGLNDIKSQIDTLNSNLAKSILNINQSASSNRGTVRGQLIYDATECTVCLIFTSTISSSGSPGITNISTYKPENDSALSCIDISSGIASAITGAVPCGISTAGSIYLKEIIADHVYAITGTFIRNN